MAIQTSDDTATEKKPADRLPADRFYARLQWGLLALLAAMLLHGFVISRYVATPRWMGFRMVIASLLAMNLLWWSIADRRFSRFVVSRRRSSALRLAAGGFSLALNLPGFFMLAFGHMPQLIHLPIWYAAAVTAWQVGLAFLMPLLAAMRLILLGGVGLIRRGAAPGIAAPTGGSGGSANGEATLSRRDMLRTAVASVPMAALGGITAVSAVQQGRLRVHRHNLRAPWLPSRLRGLTITHISDLHVGRLYRPHMLGELVDKANGLGGDIVLVTGDIVDSSNALLPPALRALRQIESRYGMYACIGNHDEIDDRKGFIEMTRRELPLLINQRRVVDIDGEKLTIAGVDYARSDEGSLRRRGHVENVDLTLVGYDASVHGPMMAMAHHPHTWDVLKRRGVPLTLSGHTHGGQIMFTPPNERPDLGVGNLMFRYLRGFYGDERSTLFVNSGVGNWFPLRVQAPAEIVQIRLI